jgi:protein gp37
MERFGMTNLNTKIEWTDVTWSPTVGCTKVSQGCDHCYAERLVNGRMRNRYPAGFGEVRVHPDRVNLPLRWQKPRRVFVNSLSDLFHEQIPDPWRADIFAVMAAARRHTFQVLTKRPGPMASLLSRPSFRDAVRDRAMGKAFRDPEWVWEWPLPNVWLGTSVESQKWADVRIPKLLETPAAVRFLSCEPLLGPVDLSRWLLAPEACHRRMRGIYGAETICAEPKGHDGYHWPIMDSRKFRPLHWVIVGGESGPGARPMHPQWARDLRDQCQAAGVAYFFKQWGEWVPESQNAAALSHSTAGQALYVALDGATRVARVGTRGTAATVQRVGKKAAGRQLDGRTWDEYPREVGR